MQKELRIVPSSVVDGTQLNEIVGRKHKCLHMMAEDGHTGSRTLYLVLDIYGTLNGTGDRSR